MTYSERLALYEEIQKIRNNPLLVYVTSSRELIGGQMGLDVVPELCDHINNIDDEIKTIDLLVVSQGGDIIVPWRIMGILRERFKKVNMLLPYSAQSAATLLAFGANEIVMHPFACLGPIDPQITFTNQPPLPPKIISVEDVKCFLDFALTNLSQDKEKAGELVLNKLCEKIDPLKIGLIKKSMRLSETLASKLLSLHINDPNKVKKIVDEYNNKSHHGYTISRDEALKTGLPVKKPNKQLEKLIWSVWSDIEQEMNCRVPFHPSKLYDGKQICEKSHNIAVLETITERSVYLITTKATVPHNLGATTNTTDASIQIESIPIGWVKEYAKRE